MNAKVRYRQQRQAARGRGIEFLISFEQWWDIWQQSGHWEERGRAKGQYVMSRFGDTGSYEVGNVFIQLSGKNVSDAQTGRQSEKKGKKYGPHTEEHKLKNSLAHLGKPMPKTEEHRKKLSEANVGKKLSEATKAKMKESQMKRWAKRKESNG